MKADNLTVTVNTKVVIPNETAERCMRLLEMWMDDNPDKTIICDRQEGEKGFFHRMRIIKKF